MAGQCNKLIMKSLLKWYSRKHYCCLFLRPYTFCFVYYIENILPKWTSSQDSP